MLKQIFKKQVPIELLHNLLESVCLKTDKYYLVDLNAYRKIIFHEYHKLFCDNLKEYYHTSKQFYIERKFSYNSFINIIRQICKSNNVMFSSQIRYNDSEYNIEYFIYY
jgi:hypothetical protein